MQGFWEEVKTRKIFKAATIYAAVAWGIIQISDVLLPVLGVADWVMSSMVLVAFTGFPIALIFGSFLDFKKERQKLTKSASSENNPINPNNRIRLAEIMVITFFSAGAAYLYYNNAEPEITSQIVQVPSTPPLEIANSDNVNSGPLTIAVLPFANFGDSQNDEFFADGLSEELLNVLARSKKFRVAARTSSFQYKNTNVNVKTIGSELGVQYVLEGSVRRSGDLIRVTAQLIKADEDVHVFSKTWDRTTQNIFQVQDEIAQSVMGELKVSLLGEDEKFIETGTNNIEAFAEYSRALAFLRNRSKEDFENAILHFSKALELDPEYAEALARLAQTYLLQVSYGIRKFEEGKELAKPLLSKAMELNANLGVVHSVKGLFHWQSADSKEKPEAEQEIQNAVSHLSKAIEINPSLSEAYMWYGSILQQQGDFAGGAQLHKKAFDIDPQAAVAGFNRAMDLVRIGDYKSAMNVFNTVVRNNPNYASAYSIAGSVSYSVGQLDQAYGMYNRLAELSGDDMSWKMNSTQIYLPLGLTELAQNNVDDLRKTEMPHKYTGKIDKLQASIWLASRDFDSFNRWTRSFKEDTQDYYQRLWRGFASVRMKQWDFAIDDLTKALELMKLENEKRSDELTTRIHLLMAYTYQQLGNALKAEHHITKANDDINTQIEQGITSNAIRFLETSLKVLQGETEKALAMLRQSVQEGFVDMWWVEIDPIFENISKDPQYVLIKDELDIRLRLMQNNIESQYGKLAVGR